MPELPRKKIGLVSCSGEETAEGTITRLATRNVLETLRPGDTVTICLPLFLAGGKEIVPSHDSTPRSQSMVAKNAVRRKEPSGTAPSRPLPLW